jgi:hypothetical protein
VWLGSVVLREGVSICDQAALGQAASRQNRRETSRHAACTFREHARQGGASEVLMRPSSLLARLGAEVCLTIARAALALTLALAFAFTPHLFLEGMIGTLGMYAVTDAVFASLARPQTKSQSATRLAYVEGALSFVLGLLIMATDTQQGLLVAFCLRNLAVCSIELLRARDGKPGYRWLSWRAPGAYLAYAALSASALSLAFMVAAGFGYGALDLYACIAGQLWIWSSLIVAHAIRVAGQRVASLGTYAHRPSMT